MHKTVNVSIGSSPFVIEESAFATLDAYLKSIRAHFTRSGDADEIVSDIEDRIAEEFGAKVSARKKVILMKDVEDVIRMMGTVEDFKKFETGMEEEEPAKTAFDIKKLRLYRDADDQIIGGVCSGIAKFFNIDPLIVRLIFGLSIFMGGFGVVLYIILWIILPEARTTAEKVEMTGNTVTLSAIQDRIDQTLPPEKRRGFIRRLFALPFIIIGAILRGIGKLIAIVVPVLGRIAGFFLLLGACFGIAAATFVMLALLLNPSSPYIGLPLGEILGQTSYAVLLISGYLAALMPIVFVLLAGASLLMMRNQFTFPNIAGMLGIWLSALVVAGVTGFTIAPAVEVAAERYEDEHFEIVTRPYDVADFDRISVGGDMILEVTEGDAYSVTLSGTEKGLERMDVAVTEGFLTTQQQPFHDRCIFFCPRHRIMMQVTMPSLREVRTSGIAHATLQGFDAEILTLDASGNSSIESVVNANELLVTTSGVSHVQMQGSERASTVSLDASGNSDIDMTMPVDTVTATTSGVSQIRLEATEKALNATYNASGNSSIDAAIPADGVIVGASGVSHVQLRGSGATLQAQLEGNSSLDALRFPVNDAEVRLSGVSTATLDVRNALRGSASGNSDIYYRGNPPTVNVETSGAASMRSEDDEDGEHL